WVYENPKAEIKIAVIPLRNVYNGESTHAIIFVDIGSKSYETAVLSLDECCRYKKLMESLQLMPDLSAKEKKKAGEVLRRSISEHCTMGKLRTRAFLSTSAASPLKQIFFLSTNVAAIKN